MCVLGGGRLLEVLPLESKAYLKFNCKEERIIS